MDSHANSMWSNIVKKDPLSNPSPTDGAPTAILGMVGKCNSTKGISIAVVDASAVIKGGQSLTNLADKLVTVPQVLTEIRDPDSRRRLEFIQIEAMEPSREALSKVDNFAKATGDFPTLSVVDRKLIALTYTLEAMVHGTKNLRDLPLPIKTVRVKRLTKEELPGWGSNVANIDEWEPLEKETEELSNSNSKILALKDLNMNIIPQDEEFSKTEINHQGKMVVEGVDASQGQCDDDHSGDWIPAVSRKTRTKLLKRKARRDDALALAEQNTQQDQELEENVEIASDASSVADDVSSEHALSKSTIACITGDYAMQNVILQMGLRLLAPGGMQIRQLKRWKWLCHGCYKDTLNFGTGFCSPCGNIGTLLKVAVTIDKNGTTIAACKPRITLRGTKEEEKESPRIWFYEKINSLDFPRTRRKQTNWLVQCNLKVYSLLLKETFKANFGFDYIVDSHGDEYFASDDVFLNHHSHKNAPFQPPVRQSMAIFRQKRNPNDNHYSRSLH